MHRVTIYAIVCSELGQDLPGTLQTRPVPMRSHLARLTSVLVPSGSNLCDVSPIAAEGWAKAIGLARSEQLRELQAPQNVVVGCTTSEGVLDQGHVQPAPSCWAFNPDATFWILDNDVECWLLMLELIDSRRHSP